MSQMKYVATNMGSIVIFTDNMKHDEIGKVLKERGETIESAGRVMITIPQDKVIFMTYGQSLSLTLVANPEDAETIQRNLGGL